ncbi:MAG: esterase family protein [Anaerolineales bacterium]|nr:esterase family protein [Anaerolineales bacterium]
MHQSAATWIKRAVAIVALTMLVALWGMAHPVSAPNPPSPTPTLTAIPTDTPTPSPTPTRTPLPTWTPTPTSSPTPTPPPTETPAPTEAPTEPLSPEATPVLSETLAMTGTLETPDVGSIEATTLITATETPNVPASRIEEHSYASSVTGVEERYLIYLPPAYDASEQRYPVLYLFHGWPIASSNWDLMGADEVANQAIITGQLPPFIIVMPLSTEGLFVWTSGGASSFEAQVINDLVPHIDATYRTWATREGRALGGISRGGVWSLEIAFMHPDLFGVVAAHSPALSVNLAPPAYDPFYLRTRPGVETLRIYLDAGDQDWAIRGTEQLHLKLEEQGIVHTYVVHEGRHHSSLWSAHMGEYLAFHAGGWWPAAAE